MVGKCAFRAISVVILGNPNDLTIQYMYKAAIRLAPLILFLLTAGTTYAQTATYYVATNGSDASLTGSLANPFKTINKAITTVRALNKSNYTSITVYVKAGTYRISSPLSFGSSDSGTASCPITYRNYGSDEVIISGGIVIPGSSFTLVGGKYRASFPNPNSVRFRQLYLNNAPLTRARLDIGANPASVDIAQNKFVLNTALIGIHLMDLSRAELVTTWKWYHNRMKVGSINSNDNEISINGPVLIPTLTDLPRLDWLENALGFLDQPGEWFYDPSTAYLYLKPPAGVTLSSSSVVIPVAEKLIQADGISYVSFKGLKFSDATWERPGYIGYETIQGSVYIEDASTNYKKTAVPSALSFSNCNHIEVSNCVIRNVGGDGLGLESNCNNVNIKNNEFYQIASSGIRLGSCPNCFDNVQDCVIESNTIHDVARDYKAGVGIFLLRTQNIQILNNQLYDLPYSAIAMGIPDGENIPIIPGGHTVDNNTIHDILKNGCDGAGIYNFGRQTLPGEIYGNHIYGIQGHGIAPRAAIYLDEYSNNFLVAGNYGDEIDYYQIHNGVFANAHVFNHIRNDCYKNTVTGNYFGAKSFWIMSESLTPQLPIAGNCCGGDMGVRFVDVNWDGLKDMIMFRWIDANNQQMRGFINTGTGWTRNDIFSPPYYTSIDDIGDAGSIFVDFDGDQHEDIIYRRKNTSQKGAWRNTGSGWAVQSHYVPPIDLLDDSFGELGVRAVDVNHDGLKDLVYYRWDPTTPSFGVYLNDTVAQEWVLSSNTSYQLPFHINSTSIKDLGARFVDLNNDGFDDLIYNRNGYPAQKGAYLNSGTGWTWAPEYTPQIPIADDVTGDLGVRFIDLDRDGDKDMLYYRQEPSGPVKHAYYNYGVGTGWAETAYPGFFPTIPITDYSKTDTGVRFVDLNGDGRDDLIKAYWVNSTTVDTNVYLNDSWDYACDDPGAGARMAAPEHDNLVTGIDEKTKDQTYVFPNPTTGVFHVDAEPGSTIVVLNASGIIVERFQANETNYYDISRQSGGLYIVRTSTETYKLMKN